MLERHTSTYFENDRKQVTKMDFFYFFIQAPAGTTERGNDRFQCEYGTALPHEAYIKKVQSPAGFATKFEAFATPRQHWIQRQNRTIEASALVAAKSRYSRAHHHHE
jgi:hypothetical protein